MERAKKVMVMVMVMGMGTGMMGMAMTMRTRMRIGQVMTMLMPMMMSMTAVTREWADAAAQHAALVLRRCRELAGRPMEPGLVDKASQDTNAGPGAAAGSSSPDSRAASHWLQCSSHPANISPAPRHIEGKGTSPASRKAGPASLTHASERFWIRHAWSFSTEDS